MNRPEYIKCVLTGKYDIPEDSPGGPHLEQKTWCGRDIFREFVFQDPTHAALNGLEKGRLVACKECVDAINVALNNGIDRR